MRGDDYEGYTFVVLFPGGGGAEAEEVLRGAINPEAKRPVNVIRPAVGGSEFLSASGEVGAGLDRWWHDSLEASSMPIFLVMYDDSLPDWIPGTAGCWFVGVPGGEGLGRLGSLSEPVFPVVCEDPEIVTEQAMLALDSDDGPPLFHAGYQYRNDPLRWARNLPRLAPATSGSIAVNETAVSAAGRALHEAPGGAYLTGIPPRPYQPISYDAQPAVAPDVDMPAPPAMTRKRASSSLQAAVARFTGGQNKLRGKLVSVRRANDAPSPLLGLTINANRPIVAGFASRKGGVGKTTHAAAVAATIGEALNGLPDTAALVDGNITNPDSWALNPPPDSATVRTLVSRLSQAQDPPPEQYARTPRLAIYPESRESEELYTHAEVDLVAEYLRRRHAFVAIDLPNALPSLSSGGPGAVAAAWLVHCDIVVLPFNADPRARQGLLEYVAVLADDRYLAGTPILAPYIVSANRAISTDPAVQRDMGELRRRGVEITEVPDDESAMLALLRDLPINRASPGLRRAYLQMSQTLVDIVLRSRQAK